MSTNVGFIGFGLIAGALAHALKESGKNYHIIATSRHLEPVNMAVTDGIVDEAASGVDNTFAKCDIIVLCTPVITITEYMEKLKGIVSSDCIITDVGSVKTIIHEAAGSLGLDSQFIGGHPMAGSEKTGYENSSSSIIRGAKYIITPTQLSRPDKIELMKQFALDVGMYPIVMDYRVHDKSVAAISHVPHLLSTALVHVVSDNDDKEKHMQLLAAGCFRDMSRVAASSPEMWEQICLTNSDAISNILEQYIDMLNTIKENIDRKTPGYVARLFEMSRDYRNSLEKEHPEQ
ncbi:MAG: prephenate dehydrogenase [Lachnospira sp.]